jgi:hypothetical protein
VLEYRLRIIGVFAGVTFCGRRRLADRRGAILNHGVCVNVIKRCASLNAARRPWLWHTFRVLRACCPGSLKLFLAATFMFSHDALKHAEVTALREVILFLVIFCLWCLHLRYCVVRLWGLEP